MNKPFLAAAIAASLSGSVNAQDQKSPQIVVSDVAAATSKLLLDINEISSDIDGIGADLDEIGAEVNADLKLARQQSDGLQEIREILFPVSEGKLEKRRLKEESLERLKDLSNNTLNTYLDDLQLTDSEKGKILEIIPVDLYRSVLVTGTPEEDWDEAMYRAVQYNVINAQMEIETDEANKK